jgi:hypothetical protein
VWGVGSMSLLLNLFALANLDFLNVLLLLPSLMFSVSTLVGPFLMQPRPGRHLGRATGIPKLLGWGTSFGFYLAVAWLIAGPGWAGWLGGGAALLGFGGVLRAGLPYLGYSQRLRRMSARLSQMLIQGGMPERDAPGLAHRLLFSGSGNREQTVNALQPTPLSAERRSALLAFLHDQALPCLQRPAARSSSSPARHRFLSEARRSFVLGLFTFAWFAIVPVPGLLVFTAPGGRFSISLLAVLTLAAGAVGLVLAGGALSLCLEWWEKNRAGGDGLAGSIASQYRTFQRLQQTPGRIGAFNTSNVYALFTDVQTYYDQRSYAYARRSLHLIRQILKGVASPDGLAT